MAFNTSVEAWYDEVYVSVSRVGGSEVELCSRTNSLSVSGGGFDVESIQTFCGKIARVGTRDDLEISFDGVPLSTQDFDWAFHGVSPTSNTITSSDEIKHRVTLLWTDQTGVTAATQAITTASTAYRQIYAEAYCTELEYNMDAGENLSVTMGFMLPVEDVDGNSNVKKEACDTASTLSAVSAYTTSTKW